MKIKQRIRFVDYLMRTCKSLHFCELCHQDITFDQKYYDGGYGRRAHDLCAEADQLEIDTIARLVPVQIKEPRE